MSICLLIMKLILILQARLINKQRPGGLRRTETRAAIGSLGQTWSRGTEASQIFGGFV